MSKQMRAEFSKHCQLWRYSEEVDENDFFINVTTQRAWDVWVTAWQASRQTLVVELPEGFAIEGSVSKHEEGFVDGYNDALKDACVALDKAGVSYK
jgi:hypothetical protein